MSGTLYYDVDGVLLDFTGPFVDYWNAGLEGRLWIGSKLEKNPNTWNFGLKYGVDDMKEVNKALDEFHRIHDHLPIMHKDIPNILNELKSIYKIELVTAYPDEKKRIENLLHHNLPYDRLICNINDKLSHIKESENNGAEVVAIFEDGPHHLNKLLTYYDNKVWAPGCWKYLEPYKNDSRVRLYETPHEWKTLVK